MNKNGEILGKGSYGCVIPDILDCTNKDNSTFKKSTENVSKLFLDLEEYQIELHNTKYINNIDINNDYTIKLELSCLLNNKIIKKILDDNGINKKYLNNCEIKNKSKIYQIVYNKKGTILKDINIDIKKLIKLSLNLVKGIELFNNNKFIHFDIKSNNVIYIEEDDKLIYIDFGLAVINNDYNYIFRIFDKYYFKNTRENYPPEFIILSLIEYYVNKVNYNNIDENLFDLNKILYDVVYDTYNNNFIRYMDNHFKNSYINELYKLLKKYYIIKMKLLKKNNYENIFNKYLIKYSNKIEIFAFGIMMFNKLYKMRKDNNDDEIFKKYFKKILKYTLIADPSKRYNASKIINKYK